MNNLQRTTLLLLLLIAIVFILIVGKTILIPIVLAALVWFVIRELRNFVSRVPFIKKRVPSWLLNLLSVTILYFVVGTVVHMLINNINALSENLPVYEANLAKFSNNLADKLAIDLESVWNNLSGEFDFSTALSSLLGSLSDMLGNVFMIGLYILFILLEESSFGKKLFIIYNTPEKREEVLGTLTRISDSISSYIGLKTLVSILTGGLSYIALAIIGVDSPLFWAFLIFILNFIPTVGSLIATIFPTAMALLQFGDITSAIFVLASVGVIQVIVGNIIEPRVMGNSLNVSSFVVILALSFWGAIWGITGMVLSVPITVILIILLGQFESTRSVAILLSEKGNIDEPSNKKA